MSPLEATYFGISAYTIFWVLTVFAFSLFAYRISKLIRYMFLGQKEKGFGKLLRRGLTTTIITLGIDYRSARTALEMAARFERVFASVGIHPHNAKSADHKVFEKMEDLALRSEVVAYGEIGLDYFRNRAPRDLQVAVFREQLSLGKKLEFLPGLKNDIDQAVIVIILEITTIVGLSPEDARGKSRAGPGVRNRG